MSQENKVYRRESGKGIEGHKLTSEPIPTPGPGQALIRIHAISLNYRDLSLAAGKYGNVDIPSGVIPISDGAGEVVKVGEGVSNVKVGDRVTPNFSNWVDGEGENHIVTGLGGFVDGVAAQYIVINAELLVHIPEGLSYEEAAALPCAAVTAWNSLFEGDHPVRPGETVLIQGTGGVSIFGLQLAVAAGARVIVTSSKEDKLEKARKLGAAKTVNYTKPDWEKEVLEYTAGKGVNHIIEVGGKDSVLKSMEVAAYKAHIYVVGGVSGIDTGFPLLSICIKNLRIRGILIGSVKMFERMNAAISLHNIKPQVDKVFSFEQLQEALKYLESGKHFGKVVVRVS